MGKRVRPKSTDTFESEVQRQFGPLADEWRMEGPVDDALVIPGVTYTLDRLTYHWMLDPGEGAVSVGVRLVVAEGRLSCWVDDLVTGNRLGAAQDVRGSARTWHSLQLAVASHTSWIKRMHPVLTSPDAQNVMERAGALTSTRDLE